MKNASAKPPVHPQLRLAHLELGCAAGSVASLRAAVDNGANNIYLTMRPCWTNKQTNFADLSVLKKGISYAHARRRKVVFAVRFRPHEDSWRGIGHLIAQAVSSGIDALAFSNPEVMFYCAINHPCLPLYYAAPQDRLNPAIIRDFRNRFGIGRVILPPVCSLALIEQLQGAHLEVEVRIYGGSTSIIGPTARGEHKPRYHSPLPAITKSTFSAPEEHLPPRATAPQSDQCAIEETASNDFIFGTAASCDAGSLALIPKLARLGVHAIHVDSSLHDAADLARVTRVWHEAVNACYADSDQYAVKPGWIDILNRCSKHSQAG